MPPVHLTIMPTKNVSRLDSKDFFRISFKVQFCPKIQIQIHIHIKNMKLSNIDVLPPRQLSQNKRVFSILKFNM